MTTPFKTPFKLNSRFDCLIDTSVNNNDLPNNKSSFNNKGYSQNKGYFNNKAFNKPIFKTNKVFEFNTNLFPALSDTKTDTKTTLDGVSYIDKINILQKENPLVGPQLDYGWCSIELDRHTNTSIFKNWEPSTPDTIPFDGEAVIDNLNSKYVTFVENYIELWGEPEYTNMFMFPNHDYDYFEKLDEEYEEFMEDIYNYNYQNEPTNEW